MIRQYQRKEISSPLFILFPDGCLLAAARHDITDYNWSITEIKDDSFFNYALPLLHEQVVSYRIDLSIDVNSFVRDPHGGMMGLIRLLRLIRQTQKEAERAKTEGAAL